MKRLLFILICLIMLITFASCNPKTDTLIDGKIVVAYFNDKPVYKEQRDQYIYMKKAFMQYIVDESNANSETFDEKIPEMQMVKQYQDLQSEMAQAFLKHSEDDWNKDYLKTFFIMDELIKPDSRNCTSIVKMIEETYTQIGAPHPQTNVESENGSYSYKDERIQEVADRFNISYDECVDQIFKPFWISEFASDQFLGYFASNFYEGDVISFDGNNAKEHIEYLKDVFPQYYKYLDQLLDQAEVKEV